MAFLLEDTDFPYVRIDVEIAKKTISENKGKYIVMTFDELNRLTKKDYKYKKYIPVGSINFVHAFYKIFFDIEKENSIEIPKILRNEKFTKRFYKILKYEDLPKEGVFFVKDATEEKTISFLGDIKDFIKKYSKNKMIKEHIFVCSEILESHAEFRFYVVRGIIKQISCYKGDCMEKMDYTFVNNVVDTLEKLEKMPKSYSFDVMSTTKGFALLEMHTYSALGNHNYMWDKSLLDAYEDCYHYYLEENYEIELD